MALETKAYTLGKGEVYFDQGTGERYLGNTTEFNITIESESLDHFDSDNGIRVKDDSVVLQITRNGTLTTDNMSKENIALFFLADVSSVTQVATPVVGESTANIKKGYFYQIGKTTANPQGVRGVTAVTVKKSPSTVLVLNTDYTLDATSGRIQILESSATMTDGATMLVDYTPVVNTRERIATSNSASLTGAIRFISKNPKGTQRDVFIPSVTLRPSGDFALKGEDWQSASFSVEIGQLAGQSAIYIDGRAA